MVKQTFLSVPVGQTRMSDLPITLPQPLGLRMSICLILLLADVIIRQIIFCRG
jgi:hypothetical protein